MSLEHRSLKTCLAVMALLGLVTPASGQAGDSVFDNLIDDLANHYGEQIGRKLRANGILLEFISIYNDVSAGPPRCDPSEYLNRHRATSIGNYYYRILVSPEAELTSVGLMQPINYCAYQLYQRRGWSEQRFTGSFCANFRDKARDIDDGVDALRRLLSVAPQPSTTTLRYLLTTMRCSL